MKRILLILVALAVLGGIGGYVFYVTPATHKVHTSKVTTAFAAASGELKTQSEAVVGAIKAEKYAEAVAALTKLVELPGLTKEQKTALYDTLTDLSVVVPEKMPTGSDELVQTITELLGKL